MVPFEKWERCTPPFTSILLESEYFAFSPNVMYALTCVDIALLVILSGLMKILVTYPNPVPNFDSTENFLPIFSSGISING